MHEYYEFDEFINYKGNITKKPKSANFQQAFEKFGQALLCCTITVILKRYIDVSYMQTAEFATRSLFYKVPFMIGSFHAPLYTMYAGFASFDANIIASGIGFRPATSKNDQPTFIAKHNMNMWLF